MKRTTVKLRFPYVFMVHACVLCGCS